MGIQEGVSMEMVARDMATTGTQGGAMAGPGAILLGLSRTGGVK